MSKNQMSRFSKKVAINIKADFIKSDSISIFFDNLKTKNFKRIRIGIKLLSKNKIPADKFVLGKFGKEESNIVNKLIEEIIEKNIFEIK